MDGKIKGKREIAGMPHGMMYARAGAKRRTAVVNAKKREKRKCKKICSKNKNLLHKIKKKSFAISAINV